MGLSGKQDKTIEGKNNHVIDDQRQKAWNMYFDDDDDDDDNNGEVVKPNDEYNSNELGLC